MVTDYTDINTALTACNVYTVAAVHPVFIGEIGDNLWDTTLINGVPEQDVWFNNTLKLLDQKGIGYAGWTATPWVNGVGEAFGFVVAGESNYTLDSSGVILINHLCGINYTDWVPATTIGGISSDSAIIMALVLVLVIVLISVGTYTYTKRSKK
jgi:hypothetical protein